jgi:sugar-specific transcriptional regulator TrmB
MEKLLSILRRDFEGFELIKASEAGLPVYFIRMAVEVLELQALGAFALYFLHAVALGMGSLADIAHLLGVEERDLLSTGAQLLQLYFIEQSMPDQEGKRLITLTDQGRRALGENATPPVPQRKNYNLHFNALTWTVMPLEEEAWSVEEMCKEGLFVLPTKEQGNPTLGDFTEKEVKACLQYEPRFQKSNIVALLKLEKVAPEYIAPIQVFLLQHQKTKEQRIAVYHNRRQLVEEAAVLQRMFEERTLIFPDEATLADKQSLALPPVLPQKLLTTTQTFVQSEEKAQALKIHLDVEKHRRRTTQDDCEHEKSQEKIRQLTEELEKQQQEMENLRRQAAEDRAEFLQTEQHREVLEQALRDAKEEIIIISPWMNRRTCNDKLCRLVGDAIARGVRIRIAYGFGNAEKPRNAERHHNNVRQVKRAFERSVVQDSQNLLEMRETRGTHQKILICDRKFAVAGSFNWLSYLGTQDGEIREETSVLLRRSEDVNKLATIALQAFSS